ncbi:MAG: helix-turn-helix transcriptional regulator [Burkholderiaceae bacterium]
MTDRDKWLKANPLRAWREKQRPEAVTRADAAARLGCSPSTILLWEQGGMPNWGYAGRLAELLGYDDSEKFRKAWLAWQRKGMPAKPTAEKAVPAKPTAVKAVPERAA